MPLGFSFVHTFSLTLSFFEMLPVYTFDGQRMLDAIVDLVFPGREKGARGRGLMARAVLACMTAMTAVSMVYSVVLAFRAEAESPHS